MDLDEIEFDDFDTTVKVIVVGNGRVGKTSITTRFCKGVFTGQYKKTIGVDFMEKKIDLDGSGEEAVTLMLWDTAGQEEFDALTSRYYRGAGAAVLVFSTTDRDSFLDIERWVRKVEDECGNIVMALVQNKVDLMDDAQMDSREVEDLARKLGVRLYRTCVKDNLNVDEVFEYVASSYLRRGGGEVAVESIGAMVAEQQQQQQGGGGERDNKDWNNGSDRPGSGRGMSSTTASDTSSPHQGGGERDREEKQLPIRGTDGSEQGRDEKGGKKGYGGGKSTGGFKLQQPSKQRTGGKKKRKMKLSSCVVC